MGYHAAPPCQSSRRLLARFSAPVLSLIREYGIGGHLGLTRKPRKSKLFGCHSRGPWLARPSASWYGAWYGNNESHHYAGGRPAAGSSRPCRRWTSIQRFGVREACRWNCPFRCGGLAGNAERRARANGRPSNGKGTRVGRRDSVAAAAEILRKAQSRVSGITFDAGGLIAVDRNDRRVLALLARARERGMRITIPATALAQAMRNPARQARLSRLVRQADTDLVALDGPDATAVGLLLAQTATADIADAHVVICARRADQAVVTSDPNDLRRISPGIALVEV
jgi:hypothetical protein